MIINISDVWQDAKDSHLRYLQPILWQAVSALRHDGKSFVDGKTASFLERNNAGIMSDKTTDLPAVINDFDNTFRLEYERTEALSIIKKLINYDEFSKKQDWDKRPWSAYKLCALGRYSQCPYCHTTSINTQLPDPHTGKGLRPQLDHYYCHNLYPYLGLTLGNLIPSCEKCNGGQCKHDTDFVLHPHLNPLFDPESIRFRFEPVPAAAAMLAGTLRLHDGPQHYQIVLDTSGPNARRADASVVTFSLRARYNEIDVRERIFRMRNLLRNLARLDMAKAAVPGLPVEVSDVVGFDANGERYKNASIGKLKIDVLQDTLAELFVAKFL